MFFHLRSQQTAAPVLHMEIWRSGPSSMASWVICPTSDFNQPINIPFWFVGSQEKWSGSQQLLCFYQRSLAATRFHLFQNLRMPGCGCSRGFCCRDALIDWTASCRNPAYDEESGSRFDRMWDLREFWASNWRIRRIGLEWGSGNRLSST